MIRPNPVDSPTQPCLVRRRTLLTRGAAAAAGAIAFPFVSRRNVLGANSRLNIAGIGAGGKGGVDTGFCGDLGENMVALCDVDERRAAATMRKYPDAKRFTDFRKMFDEIGKEIDAVTVSTPDHTHTHPAVRAMREGKHVYVQKPLTHTVEEARLLAKIARETGVVTQMGNQGHSHSGSRRSVELIRAGVLGDVREIHVWTDRPIWPQGLDRPAEKQDVPHGLDWDLWLGPAPERPYHSSYLPFNWRGWWDYGTGALGDMACHNMDIAFFALDLNTPVSIEAEASDSHTESPPNAATITWTYADGRKLVWYDGKRKPDAAIAGQRELAANGSIFVGTKDTYYVPDPWGEGLFKSGATVADHASVPVTLPRLDGSLENHDRAHHAEWIAACKGEGKALSHFDYAGPMTEVVLLGNVALRAGAKIEWDAKAM
ncbi:MAG: Gfo/Idh/MocA family oxidoreductase, partial [Verrucomicrobiae bacterium]|nr:Gfo/Idh/MocA family oxidoreductase [Verrucomicrobiae bacterium]